MIKKPIKTRFAPSPTGFMHFGNIRAALFNYLYAKNQNGHFLLRVEDTDVARSEGNFRDAIFTDLNWLGTVWDEGPYYQSERQSIYDGFYETLEAQGHTYPCFCSETQLAITRKVQLSSGQPPRYPGTCRNLTAEEIAVKKAEGIPWTLRFHVPNGKVIEFNDLVKGMQKFETDHIGDFIIRRHDGTAPFMYCNAIDDSLLGITHALRGDDHLTNTPRQIMILQALNLPVPTYGHLPTILGPDSRPLSKRNGSRSIQELRAEGYLPIGILNYLARLGHHDPDMTLWPLPALAERFNLEHIGKSAAHFDAQQLHYWQKEAMHHAPFEECWDLIEKHVKGIVPEDSEKQKQFVATLQANIVMPEEALFWAKCFFTEDWSYDADNTDTTDANGSTDADGTADANTKNDSTKETGTTPAVSETIKKAGKSFYQAALEVLKDSPEPKAFLSALQAKTNLKGKSLFMPIRAALTATLNGPELPKIMTLLGTEQVHKRFTKAFHYA